MAGGTDERKCRDPVQGELCGPDCPSRRPAGDVVGCGGDVGVDIDVARNPAFRTEPFQPSAIAREMDPFDVFRLATEGRLDRNRRGKPAEGILQAALAFRMPRQIVPGVDWTADRPGLHTTPSSAAVINPSVGIGISDRTEVQYPTG
jgi:hypothetical protein